MLADIVFPDSNEKEFIEIAEKLGYDALVLVYEKKDRTPNPFPKSKIKIITALAVPENQAQKAKKEADFVLVKSTGNDRWVLEKSEADMLFGLEGEQKRDFMHHRASGLNQVLCKIASKRGKTIGLSFSPILISKGMLRAQLIGKMMQNIRFCRKFKVKTAFASFAKNPMQMRAPADMLAFAVALGMHPKEAKDSMSWTK